MTSSPSSPFGAAGDTPFLVEQAAKRAWIEGNLKRMNEGRRRVAAPPLTLQQARNVWLDWTRANPDPALAYDAALLHHIFAEMRDEDPLPEAPSHSPPPLPLPPAAAAATTAEPSQSSAHSPAPMEVPSSNTVPPSPHTPPPPIARQLQLQSPLPARDAITALSDPSAEDDVADESPVEVTPPSPHSSHLRLRSRRVRRPFQPEEDAAILQGVRIFGPHSWNRIVAVYKQKLPRRTNIQIKDRYRVLQRQGKVG